MSSFCCCVPGSEEGRRVAPETTTTQEANDIDGNGVYDPIERSRSCTDVFFLLLFGAFLIVLFALLGYCVSMGDVYRIVNGYDDCGNVCGRVNSFFDDATGCKGRDMREYTYLRVMSGGEEWTDPQSVNRQCVFSCEGIDQYYTIGHRCLRLPDRQQPNTYVPKTGLVEFHQEVSEDLEACWPELCYLALIALVLSALMMLLFRYTIRFVVYAVLIGIVAACAAGTIFLWVQYAAEAQTDYADSIHKRRRTTYLVFAIVATLVTVGIGLVIVVLRKRIALVIELFREAGKACASMPLMLVEPCATFVALAALVCLWLYFAIWIESAGQLQIENNASAAYVKTPAVLVARWWNVLALLWMSQFIVGCQQMVIAGAVATWFFTRDKARLDWPLGRSCARLVRYHLGTVACGALCIAVVQLLRTVFRLLQLAVTNPQNRVTQCLLAGCQCCLGCFDRVLQYLTRNAYIETAMAGVGFCAAGRRAAQTLASNALRVFAINSVGDFVLLLGKAFVVVVTVLLGMELIQRKERVHHSWVPLVLAGVFAFLIAHCFITVYEMTIDTIFLCFCEDCERNDGIGRPYFMSRSLMQFVQDSKRVLRVDDEQQQGTKAASSSGKAWSTTTTTAAG